MLTNKKFIEFAEHRLVILIAHNERGHDTIEVGGEDGKIERRCPLYPGMTCQEHCGVAVEIDAPRDEEVMTKVPFIKLCPNSWLVPPRGEPVQIEETDQFVAEKVQARVETLQEKLGASLSKKLYLEILNAFALAEKSAEDEKYDEALRALAGVEVLVKKPHDALRALVEARLVEVEDEVRWQYEDAIEVGRKDDTPMSERVATVKTLVKAVDVAVYGKRLPVLKDMQAWLKTRLKER